MLYITDKLLTLSLENYFQTDKIIFGHPERATKKFYSDETNKIATDFICLFRDSVEYNVEIPTGHNWNKEGFDLAKDEINFQALVGLVVPIVATYSMHAYLSSRIVMNDYYRHYYFIKPSPVIIVDVRQFFNIDIEELNEPIQFKLTLNIENPIDETDYYPGGDNLVYKLNMPIRVETFLFSPELNPIIEEADLSFYANETFIGKSTVMSENN